ncbi:hypothetical protein ADUPG1_009195 [Aduncisulcus paluster]|uniref:Uncharacterized protein n=1 Tax=Aduncisulcus paluster TaxID=2918883 RepID=A0ABQ5KUN8_9EUKA|nr:hypothetical protein ADUPG1_009195 [Aduncisulcus paluster]
MHSIVSFLSINNFDNFEETSETFDQVYRLLDCCAIQNDSIRDTLIRAILESVVFLPSESLSTKACQIASVELSLLPLFHQISLCLPIPSHAISLSFSPSSLQLMNPINSFAMLSTYLGGIYSPISKVEDPKRYDSCFSFRKMPQSRILPLYSWIASQRVVSFFNDCEYFGDLERIYRTLCRSKTISQSTDLGVSKDYPKQFKTGSINLENYLVCLFHLFANHDSSHQDSLSLFIKQCLDPSINLSNVILRLDRVGVKKVEEESASVCASGYDTPLLEGGIFSRRTKIVHTEGVVRDLIREVVATKEKTRRSSKFQSEQVSFTSLFKSLYHYSLWANSTPAGLLAIVLAGQCLKLDYPLVVEDVYFPMVISIMRAIRPRKSVYFNGIRYVPLENEIFLIEAHNKCRKDRITGGQFGKMRKDVFEKEMELRETMAGFLKEKFEWENEMKSLKRRGKSEGIDQVAESNLKNEQKIIAKKIAKTLNLMIEHCISSCKEEKEIDTIEVDKCDNSIGLPQILHECLVLSRFSKRDKNRYYSPYLPSTQSDKSDSESGYAHEGDSRIPNIGSIIPFHLYYSILMGYKAIPANFLIPIQSYMFHLFTTLCYAMVHISPSDNSIYCSMPSLFKNNYFIPNNFSDFDTFKEWGDDFSLFSIHRISEKLRELSRRTVDKSYSITSFLPFSAASMLIHLALSIEKVKVKGILIDDIAHFIGFSLLLLTCLCLLKYRKLPKESIGDMVNIRMAIIEFLNEMTAKKCFYLVIPLRQITKIIQESAE